MFGRLLLPGSAQCVFPVVPDASTSQQVRVRIVRLMVFSRREMDFRELSDENILDSFVVVTLRSPMS